MTDEQKKAAEDALARQAEELKAREEAAKKAREELEKVMATPISKDEGEKKLAEINVQRAQLNAYRVSLHAQAMQLDIEFSNIEQQQAKLTCDEAVIRRQMLNS